jgi:putative transposase
MPRRARAVIPGVAHHLTQRGNNREVVFHSAEDRRAYLDLLVRHAARYRARILAYCLMTNHVHLVAIPDEERSLARTLAHTHSDYAIGWNRRTGRSGHLWQGRFFSCPLSEAHLMPALRYVEENPVRAGMVRRATDWEWSSARAHCEAGMDDAVLAPGWAEYFGGWNHCEWHDLLGGNGEGGESWVDLRRATLTGEPLGSREFVGRLEKMMGRRLQVFDRGRPRKVGKNASVPF